MCSKNFLVADNAYAYLYGQLKVLADQTNDADVMVARDQVLGRLIVTGLSFASAVLAMTGVFATVTIGAPLGAVAGAVLAIGGGIIIPLLGSHAVEKR